MGIVAGANTAIFPPPDVYLVEVFLADNLLQLFVRSCVAEIKG